MAKENPINIAVFNNGIICIYEEITKEDGSVQWKEPYDIRIVQQGQQQGFAMFPLMFHADVAVLETPPDKSKILFTYPAGQDAVSNYKNALEQYRMQKSGLLKAAANVLNLQGKPIKK